MGKPYSVSQVPQNLPTLEEQKSSGTDTKIVVQGLESAANVEEESKICKSNTQNESAL